MCDFSARVITDCRLIRIDVNDFIKTINSDEDLEEELLPVG